MFLDEKFIRNRRRWDDQSSPLVRDEIYNKARHFSAPLRPQAARAGTQFRLPDQ
jgi:hypothetical protein